MAQGRKTGGRQAGTPNKRTAELAARLEELGCDPITGMAEIAMDTATSPELRGRMYAELATYLYPKRKATEVKVDTGPNVIFRIDTRFSPPKSEPLRTVDEIRAPKPSAV